MEQDTKIYLGIGSAVVVVLLLGFLFNSNFSGFSGFATYDGETLATDSSNANYPSFGAKAHMWAVASLAGHNGKISMVGYVYDYNSSSPYLVEFYYKTQYLGNAYCNITADPDRPEGAIDTYMGNGHACILTYNVTQNPTLEQDLINAGYDVTLLNSNDFHAQFEDRETQAVISLEKNPFNLYHVSSSNIDTFDATEIYYYDRILERI